MEKEMQIIGSIEPISVHIDYPTFEDALQQLAELRDEVRRLQERIEQLESKEAQRAEEEWYRNMGDDL